MLGPFLETLIGGLLTGVLYSLVALGFVLIFKASGVFNFAQGAMVLFAALTLAQLIGAKDVPDESFVAAGAIVAATVGLIGWAVVFRPGSTLEAVVNAPRIGVSRRTVWLCGIAVLALAIVVALALPNGGQIAVVLIDVAAIIAAFVLGYRRTTIALVCATIGGIIAALFGLRGWPIWLALPATAAMMIALAFAIERLVLRFLVNQEGIILFMATLGIAYFIDGAGQTLWGSDIYTLNLGIPKEPMFLFENVFEGGLLVDRGELVAAVIAGLLVAVLAVFFQKTRTGRALRAVADDHAAAQSVGIPLNQIWLIVWTVSGLVALVAGVIWGEKLGVQFSISQIALKALPVLILGGFTSVPGAIVGGLIIGAGEKLAEVFLAPLLIGPLQLAGGGIENWFAYVLALLFLLVRPQGLFGERIIERV